MIVVYMTSEYNEISSSHCASPVPCGRAVYAKQLCKKHYGAMLRANSRATVKLCAAKGCSRQANGRFCASHYRRLRHGTMNLPVRGYGQNSCAHSGCIEPHHAYGSCLKHFSKGEKDPARVNDYLLQTYRITLGEREAMFANQGGVCAICKQRPPVHVDHDHACCGSKKGCRDCVRGGLCFKCNTGLSFVEKDEWLEAAREYLDNSRPFAGTPDPIRSAPPQPKPFTDEVALLHELGLR